MATKDTKEALRKRMMNYGKKDTGGRKEQSKQQSDMSLLIDQVETAKRRMTESKNKELERMARGIKPTINSRDIKEITRRNMNRFKKANEVHQEGQQQEACNNRQIQSKLEEVRQRKSKALEIDKGVSG